MKLPHLAPRLRFVLFWPLWIALALAVPLLWFLATGPLETATSKLLLDAVEILWPQAAVAVDRGGPKTHEAIRNLTAGSPLRATLIAEDGRVIAESSVTWDEVPSLESQHRWSEVQSALATGQGTAIRRDASGVGYAYAARSFMARDGEVYVLRLARPLQQVRFLTRNLALTLALTLVGALALLGPMTWWLNRRLFLPLSDVIASAERLASGDLASRTTVPEAEELATLASALNHLADEVDRQLRRVGAQRDRLREILASMSEGVLVIDGEDRVLLSNPQLARIFGLEGDLEGRAVFDLFPRVTWEPMIRAASAGAAHVEELDLKEPEQRALSLLASPLPGAQGVVVVVRDMTQTLRQAEIRRDLVANVSHELKTPLTAIRGYAETLRDGALRDGAVAPRFVGRILDQCERLEALLRDLLTLARLERGGERPATAELLDLRELVLHAVEALTPRAADNDVELTLEAAENPGPMARGARSECENLLLNLIENGIKYNRPGGEVRISLGLDGREATIEVADTGIGIPRQALERIFERFYRVDKGRARDQGGTGLGLSIVKHAARALGGRVEVESRLGEGSVFRVYLPRAEAVP